MAAFVFIAAVVVLVVVFGTDSSETPTKQQTETVAPTQRTDATVPAGLSAPCAAAAAFAAMMVDERDHGVTKSQALEKLRNGGHSSGMAVGVIDAVYSTAGSKLSPDGAYAAIGATCEAENQ